MENAPVKGGDIPGLRTVLVLALGIGLLCLSGCGTTASFRDPSYTGQDFKTDPVAFIPMRFTEVGMEAHEEFRKAFKNEPENGGETKLADAFNKAFQEAAKAKVQGLRLLDSGPAVDPYRREEVKLLLNKGKKSQSAMRIDILRKSAADSIVPPVRFIIAARNASFSYNEEEKPGTWTPGHTVSTPAGPISTGGTMAGGGQSKVVTLSMSFVVWDYRKDAPVSYGKFSSQMSASYFFTQGEWTGMMERAARHIAQHLP